MTQSWQVITGDSRASLAEMPDASVHCCVTSPPYWGLRDYGVDGQMGLEKSPAEFVAGMVGVFREVRRVLRDDGTAWINMGDSYSGSGKGGNPEAGKQATNRGSQSIGTLYGKVGETAREAAQTNVSRRLCSEMGMASKQLMGVPWRLALALQDDGWYLRQDIIWAKPNPMPESVTDRCTKAHEYIFLLSKSPRYFYDAKAIAEPSESSDRPQPTPDMKVVSPNGETPWMNNRYAKGASGYGAGLNRNARSVWTIATQPSSVPHYAMFPEELPRRCIKAGCPVGGVVLDPFSGMATTGKVAIELGRSYIGIELNPKYAEDSRKRLRGVSPLLAMEASCH